MKQFAYFGWVMMSSELSQHFQTSDIIILRASMWSNVTTSFFSVLQCLESLFVREQEVPKVDVFIWTARKLKLIGQISEAICKLILALWRPRKFWSIFDLFEAWKSVPVSNGNDSEQCISGNDWKSDVSFGFAFVLDWVSVYHSLKTTVMIHCLHFSV